jgi:hypothetical protein
MDRDTEMMMHQFMEKEAIAATNEDEYFTILACLLHLQAYELKKAAPKRGGSKFGRKFQNQGRRWRQPLK